LEEADGGVSWFEGWSFCIEELLIIGLEVRGSMFDVGVVYGGRGFASLRKTRESIIGND
jgi:hypothetical protein